MSEESQALLTAQHPQGVAGLDEEIRFLGSNLRETLAHYRILFPELISYRGGLFVEKQFDQRLVDDLFDQSAFDSGESATAAAEDAINSVGLLGEGEVPHDDDHEVEFDAEVARANAEAIGWFWKRWIRETYAVEIDVAISIDGPDSCYVTFHSLPTEQPG